MRVVIISAGQDTGGQGFRIRQAFRRLAPDWKVDSLHSSDTYLNFPSHLKYETALAQKLYDEADVVHFKNGPALYARHDNNQRKPIVVHHQGSRLRGFPTGVYAESASIGATQVVSTIDLMDDAPGSQWLPSPFDLDWIRDKYRVPNKGKPIRIAHSPTNRKVKGTDYVIAVINELSRWHDIELDLIEKREWVVSLSRKGRADIFVDQLYLGIGNAAVEAMAMGIPVIAGFAEQADEDRFLSVTGETQLPFYSGNSFNLIDRLRELVTDADLRAEVGARGRAYAERWHSEEFCVRHLGAIWEQTPKSKGVRYMKPFKAPLVAATKSLEKRREPVHA